MKKTALTFAAIAIAAASFASAKGARQPAWDHANDAGPIASLKEVQRPGVKRAAKSDDSTKFIAENTGTRQDDGSYRYLGRRESR